MAGETDLNRLLVKMAPELIEGEYVFCSLASACYGDHQELQPLATIKEAKGLTLLVPRKIADEKGLDYESVFRGITLTVHSSLDAVGLTAAVSSKLAEKSISANVISGYYHDHIFVQAEYADQAMAALIELVHSQKAPLTGSGAARK